MTVLQELGTYLQTQSIGTLNTDMFLTKLPVSPNNCVGILDTGGQSSDSHFPSKNLTFQIIVRNTSYDTAMNKAIAIRELLHTNDDTLAYNTILTAGVTKVMRGEAIQEPYNLGQDKNGRYEISTNYSLKVINLS